MWLPQTADILPRDVIGLTNYSKSTDVDIVVELTMIGFKDRKLLPMNELINNLERDPDLSLVPSQDLPALLQTVHVSTGCDYISFSVLWIRKEQFL